MHKLLACRETAQRVLMTLRFIFVFSPLWSALCLVVNANRSAWVDSKQRTNTHTWSLRLTSKQDLTFSILNIHDSIRIRRTDTFRVSWMLKAIARNDSRVFVRAERRRVTRSRLTMQNAPWQIQMINNSGSAAHYFIKLGSQPRESSSSCRFNKINSSRLWEDNRDKRRQQWRGEEHTQKIPNKKTKTNWLYHHHFLLVRSGSSSTLLLALFVVWLNPPWQLIISFAVDLVGSCQAN